MSGDLLESLLYLVLLLGPLLFLQRFLQREIQSIFLLITHQPEISMALFSIIFFPGVLLHEGSHYLMARLLGVRTGRFSLIPKKLGNGRLQLGYVETAATDFFRDALIGAAPLIVGGVFVAIIGVARLELNIVWENIFQNQGSSFGLALNSILAQPDFWLWFYLVFSVSSTMMPSPSDRRAWLPLIAILAIISGIILLLGAGPWIASRFDSMIISALNAITIVFGTTILVHLVLFPPVWILHKMISRISGYQVV